MALPGRTVRFGEKLTEAVTRIAKRELGIDVRNKRLVGYIEYPSHYENNLDCPVGIVFEVTNYEGKIITNYEASNGGWFEKLPESMHSEQRIFLDTH